MKIGFGLRPRIAATVAVAVLASTVAVTFAAYELERSGTESRFLAAARAGAAADLQQAANAVDRQPGRPAATAVRDFIAQRTGIHWAVLDGADGTALGTVDTAAIPDELVDAPYSAQPHWTRLYGSKQLALGGRVGTTTVTLVEFYDFGPVDAQLSRLRRDLIRVDVVGLVAALVLGVLVATGVSRPVRMTARAAQRLGSGDLDTRVPVHGRDELGELAASFNEMAERLAGALRAMRAAQAQQRRFVSDVSHELRTPLSAMLAAAEGLDAADPAARARAAELVGEQTRRMNALVEDLLEISRFDAGQARLELEPVDLTALAADAVRTVAPGAAVRIEPVGESLAELDARRVHTVVRNLVANAVQHGRPPVRVVIDGRDANWVHLAVSDSGPGVDPDIVPTIFDRFVRAESSRTASGRRSTGLGLAIARENALLHDGALGLLPDGPTTFVLTVPRAARQGMRGAALGA